MNYQLDELSRIERLTKAMNEYRTGYRGRLMLSQRERSMALAQALKNVKQQAAHPDIVRLAGLIDMATVDVACECSTCPGGPGEAVVSNAVGQVLSVAVQILQVTPPTKVIPVTPDPNSEYAVPGQTYRPK